MELSGRSILLTGASGGIGSAAAGLLAREGAKLTLFARGPGPLEIVRRRIESLGGAAVAVSGDVRKPGDAARAVVEAVGRFGGLDAVVNNAGFGSLAPFRDGSETLLAEHLETNVLGTFRVSRAALPALEARGRGVIVNVASFAGRVGAPNYSYYNASKFALVGMSEAWRRELLPLGIDVVLVIPQAVETAFLDRMGRDRALGAGPAGTVVSPSAVARAIVAGLRRPRPEIYLPAHSRWLAAMNVLWPGLSDRIMIRLFRGPKVARR
ncbi:MAG: SDR family oxidoreductase [Candidatus Latescibacteria bacterium]|nr:SDR family oxidoreductase [Candidatus Latescibacterota bacterium]